MGMLELILISAIPATLVVLGGLLVLHRAPAEKAGRNFLIYLLACVALADLIILLGTLFWETPYDQANFYLAYFIPAGAGRRRGANPAAPGKAAQPEQAADSFGCPGAPDPDRPGGNLIEKRDRLISHFPRLYSCPGLSPCPGMGHRAALEVADWDLPVPGAGRTDPSMNRWLDGLTAIWMLLLQKWLAIALSVIRLSIHAS
jgi:hypothetical protein